MAGFLGKVVRGQISSITNDETVVDPGVEFQAGELFLLSGESFDLTSDSITYSNNGSGVTYNSAFFSFTDRDGTIPDIVNVEVESTVGVTIDPSRLSFTANRVEINFTGLTVASGQGFTLDVDFAPEPEADTLDAVAEDSGQRVIPVATLLLNDTDADLDEGEALTVTGVGDAVGGTATLDGSNVLFTPAADYFGPASFGYTVSDGNGGAATGAASFDVTSVNDLPVARDDGFAASENGPAIAGNVLTNTVPNGADSDADGGTLTVSAVAGSAGNVGQAVAGSSGGLFTIAADGALSFDANDDFEALNNGQSATTTVTYTVSDGQGGTDAATVTVTVDGAAEPPAIFTSGNDGRNLDAYDLELYSQAQATRALAGRDVVQLSGSQSLGVAFHGQAGNDTVTGVGGTDRIHGDANNDLLHGKGGGDTLFGGSGDDRLFGDAGADHLHGGGGDDTFVLVTGDVAGNGKQTDVVHDFVDGEDRLDVGDLAWDGRRGRTDPLDDAGVSVTDTGAGTLITFSSGATVTARIFLDGFDSGLLDRTDFVL